MNFNFTEVETKEGAGIIKPGITEVKVKAIEDGVFPFDENIKAVIMTFEDTTTGAILKQEFSLEVKPDAEEGKSPHQMSMQRIKHIGTKIVDEDTFNKIKNINELSATLVGKTLRLKITAKEYKDKEGNVRVRSQLPLYRFAESINIPANKTTLTYDPKNQWDYKVFAETAVADKKDDLPF